MTIIIQINGKMRGEIEVKNDLIKDQIEELAQKEPNVVKYLAGKNIKIIVFVPGKIVNFVV